MSATFPDVLKAVWIETLGRVPLEIQADNDTLKQFRRHTLHVLETDLTADIILDQIVSRYQQDEAVLVVATTVGRAQKLFAALRERVGDGAVWLLHSRFTSEDRAEKERLLGSRVGTGYVFPAVQARYS